MRAVDEEKIYTPVVWFEVEGRAVPIQTVNLLGN
jgi:hypothetical protein